MSIRKLLTATALLAVAIATARAAFIGPPENPAIYFAALLGSLLIVLSLIGAVAVIIFGRKRRFTTGLILVPLGLLGSTLLLADRLRWLLPLGSPGPIDFLPLWGFLVLASTAVAALVAYFAWVIRLTLNVRISRPEKTCENATNTSAVKGLSVQEPSI
jgi:hypothetical protein